MGGKERGDMVIKKNEEWARQQTTNIKDEIFHLQKGLINKLF
jgi:hypothetical protein